MRMIAAGMKSLTTFAVGLLMVAAIAGFALLDLAALLAGHAAAGAAAVGARALLSIHAA